MLKKKILAVSGGIDSVVMLDLFCKSEYVENTQIVVAHFDHGVRENSKDDAVFVEKVCEKYGVRFEKSAANLGKKASEDLAREKRYEFLHNLAKKYDAEIYTAHHMDDLSESIAINLLRGTSWRGLAVLNAPNVHRPLLDKNYMPQDFQSLVPMTKKAIYKYAGEHNLNFREDQTNSSDEYLRNRLRHEMNNFNKANELYILWKKQLQLKAEVERFFAEIVPNQGEKWQRNWFNDLDNTVALEILRAGLEKNGVRATYPQLNNFLDAIRTYASGKYFNLPNDKLVKIRKDYFIL